MSEQIREQVSAFLDGELPASETELLLKRLTRDAELRGSFGRYALIGECLRGGARTGLSRDFATRVNRAIDGEEPAGEVPSSVRPRRLWWRPFAGAAVAAGVAAIAVVGLQHREVIPGTPLTAARSPVLASSAVPVASIAPKEALSYTVPTPAPDAPVAMPAARLTNYVFAHSKYSTVMGQNDVLNDLLSEADAEQAGAAEQPPTPRDPRLAP